MTTNSDRASAQIFQFPARGRFAVASRSDDKSTMNAAVPRAAMIAMGGAWYHDEAIEEAARDRNN